MARKVFYSFHYKPDVHRVARIRNIGAIEGNKPASDNDWEKVTNGGDSKIKEWIDNQLKGRSCTAVLIGEKTAGRRWINYEIKKSWEDKKGVFGIYIHNLVDLRGNQTKQGKNPFDLTVNGLNLSKVVKAYNPRQKISGNVYHHIKDNIEDWIEEAIEIRKKY
ncbi:hypothetical protein HNP89_000944 [Methanococcus maripaludis]|uniref:Thoeris protein ThsB TIR-like domain-containing protein n=1 Tax=Methanococcus maripaludis TaxID=39152 RepID=A0A7J9P0A5_METMI|nr:TIR domain-containing protein [Methanococcus maripaludis]MBA2852987.1 hypothetical protein [Methanococcus maripaludis]